MSCRCWKRSISKAASPLSPIPKSSTGRLDILTRLIGDRSHSFDRLDKGYSGPLYVEIAPRTFSVVVHAGTRLNQLRFRRGSPVMAEQRVAAPA